MFYDRFALANTLAATRFNGENQQQYVITNPDFFPVVPSPSSLGVAATAQSVERISSTLRAPYLMQSAITVERQLPVNTTIAAPTRTRMAYTCSARTTSTLHCQALTTRRFPAAEFFRSAAKARSC